MLIVDNYVFSFAFHLENGIPIVPFFGDQKDTEMIKVIRYLEHIRNHDDLRIQNDKIFQLTKILNSNIDCFIKYYNFDVISDNDEDDDDEIEERSLNQSIELKETDSIQRIDSEICQKSHTIDNDEEQKNSQEFINDDDEHFIATVHRGKSHTEYLSKKKDVMY